MADLLNDIIDYIIAGELAIAKDTDIFKDYAPATPDTCISVFEYAGTPPAPFTDVSVRSIQITCRSKNIATAKSKSWAVYGLLHSNEIFITLNNRKCLIQMRNTPVKIAVDEQGRVIYAFNCGITTTND